MSDQNERLYDRLLVIRCQAGDEDAYRELISRYAPRLRYFLKKQSSSGVCVDDLLQEVWLDAFRQLSRLTDVGAFTAWIYRIARGKLALEARRNGQTPTTTQGLETVIAPDDERTFSPEDAKRVHAMLDRLSSEHREVLLLRFLEELSYDEIGQVLGCPVGTVRSRIHYAKQALARMLTETNQGEQT